MAKKPTPIPKKVPAPAQKHISPLLPLVIIGVVVTGGLIGFILNRASNDIVSNMLTNTANENTSTANLNTTSNQNVNTATNTSTTTTSTWTTAKVTTSPNLLPKMWDPISDSSIGTLPAYYTVGTLKTTKYNGATVLLVSWFGEGLQIYPTITYFLKLKDGSYVFPMKGNGGVTEVPLASIFPQKTVVDTTFDPDLPDAPTTIEGPKAHQTLILDPDAVGFFSEDQLSVAFTDATYGPVYWYGTKTYTKPAKMIGSVPFSLRGGFTVRSPIGLAWTYRLKFDFMTETADDQNYIGVPSITWTDGTKNTDKYVASSYGGCGVTNYADVASEVALTTLTKSGTLSTGEIIYEYTDTNTAALKTYYNTTYQVYEGYKKVSYADFVADHPIVFFKDSFGRLIRMSNNSYQTTAECGKPVVYLYPTKATQVSVKLSPVGGFSKTEPVYNSGWNVLATPNGQLTNLANGKIYPYLFWEGRGGLYSEPAQGFAVAQRDVHSFLTSSLGKLGLNTTETNDFIEFWKPRMQGSPYYKISFMGNQTMNQLAPLMITPKPDSVIRILMDYQPLSQKIDIQPQQLKHIPRTGFTVVEWGGVLR